ncbi:MAG TPA: ABC transporter permease subunit/CPBP intramembrane protease [Gemmataceae bacterium]|jgi:sodium transport system permease protein
MRWSIVRLIWLREMRDQLRDRRTVFMIAVLPILLYPVGGFGIIQLTQSHLDKQAIVGVQGWQDLPPLTPHCSAFSPAPVVAWLTMTPVAPGVPLSGVERVSAAAALHLSGRNDPRQDYPPLFLSDGNNLLLPSLYLDKPEEARTLILRSLDAPTLPCVADACLDNSPTNFDRSALDNRQVDVLVVVPTNFQERLLNNGRPLIYVLKREDDDHSRLADFRLTRILRKWMQLMKEVRLLRQGLPPDYDEVIEIRDAIGASKPVSQRTTDDVLDMLVRIFPFVLVMWSLAGALYPAVDLCAGEKERGTMETLLISPAGRAEIVCGKFLTIWVFSAATALLNLASLTLTIWQFGRVLGAAASFRPAALFWAVALLLPLSAFFSAICLSIGAYARSTKEGQYYLMPLFLVTLPLILLTLAPGVELNHFYSMIPVTGVALLLQKLMAVKPPDNDLWRFFLPVLAPMLVYSWLALRWAIEQFQREEVLFREAERLDVSLWLRRLFREKEALPSAGQALFCFALIFGLHWLLLGSGRGPLASYTAVRYLAFVAAPPLFMVLMLTTRPLQGLSLRWPPWWTGPAGATLAVLLLPPFATLTLLLLDQFPHIKQAAASGFTNAIVEPQTAVWIAFVFLPALCEELAFRGFILNGLRSRYRPWTAVFLSSFLYALYQMNVLQALPHFLLGVVLALLAVRSGSLGGAIVFRLVWEMLLWGPVLLRDRFPIVDWVNGSVVAACLILAVPLLSFLRPLPAVRSPSKTGTESGWRAVESFTSPQAK